MCFTMAKIKQTEYMAKKDCIKIMREFLPFLQNLLENIRKTSVKHSQNMGEQEKNTSVGYGFRI